MRFAVIMIAVSALLAACDENESSPLVDPCPDMAVVVTDRPLSLDGRIVFTSSDPFGSDQLFAIDPSGSNRTQLSYGASSKYRPTWSPDGSEIVFMSDSLVGYDTGLPLYRMRADGSDVRPLKVLGQYPDGDEVLLVGGNPDWSPDGNKIVFKDQWGPTISMVDLVRDTVFSLVDNTASNDYPRWSPDGSRIAFVSNLESGQPGLSTEVYTVDSSGGDLQRHTFLEERLVKPAWSPDGSRIVFSAVERIEVQHMLCASSLPLDVNPTGGKISPMSWSPDGGHLLMIATQPSTTSISYLYIANLATGQAQLLVDDDGVDWADWWWD